MEEQDKIRQMRLDELRKEIQKGDIGDPIPFDAERIKKRGRELKAQRADKLGLKGNNEH